MNTHRPSNAWLIVALCPAFAISETVVGAVGLSVAMLVTCVVSSLAKPLANRLSDEAGTAILVLILAATVTSLSLLMGGWTFELRRVLGLFLPLLAVNLAIVSGGNPGNAMRGVVWIVAAVLALGLARELVGRGSVFYGAANALGSWAKGLELQLFPADMGFLLAALPPGAFIAFGLLLAARNWIARRHEPRQSQ